MITDVFAGAENLITSLGFTSDENITSILEGNQGIVIDDSRTYSPFKLPLSKVDHVRMEGMWSALGETDKFTRMEKLFILSIKDAIRQTDLDVTSEDTLFLLTTTKGNIDLLDPSLQATFGRSRIFLHEMGRMITTYFKNPNRALIISNACTSGVLGIITGERLIRDGKFRHVVVSGGDLLSEFIISGFLSFQSLSEEACKPFDKDRSGLTLGEGCGTMILSSDPSVYKTTPVKVLGGAGSNDANHISGPSRTGEGLYLAINQALKIAGVGPADIDTISAHGTATDYNDEMEAKAFSRACLEGVPLNSYKGYFGHTLGAAGVIESAICLQSMERNMLFRSAGYGKQGVSGDIHVIRENTASKITTCLKTASGFGGSNAALVFQKM